MKLKINSEKCKNIIKRLLLFVVLVVFFIIIEKIFPSVFGMNDDRTMRNIILGAYTGTPDGHAIFMGYPLTYIMSKLYIVAPFIPWYGVLFGTFIIFSTYIVTSYIIFYNYESNISRVVMMLVLICIFIGIYINNFLQPTFTIVASVLGSAVIFENLTQKRKKVIIALLMLTFCVRKDIFVMLAPFMVATVIWNCLNENKNIKLTNIIKKCIPITILLIIVWGVGVISNNVGYLSDEWKTYENYNEARTQLYDYTDIAWCDDSEAEYYINECKELGLGDLKSMEIKNYDILFDDEITPEIFTQVSNKITKDNQLSGISKIKNVLHIIYKSCTSGQRLYFITSISLLILFSVFLMKDRKKLILVWLVWLGKYIIMAYLAWKGRMPPRVILPIYYYETLFIVGGMVTQVHKLKKSPMLKKIVIFALIGVIFLMQIRATIYTADFLKTEYTNIDAYNELIDYCQKNSENIYLLKGSNTDSTTTDYVYKEKNQPFNFYQLEPWTSHSPLWNNLINGMNATGLLDLIYQNNNVKVILTKESEYSALETLLNEKYGDAKLKIDDVIEENNMKHYVVSVERMQ
jgi:hypothetical protein